MLILPTWIPYSNDTSESQSIILLLLLMTWFFFFAKRKRYLNFIAFFSKLLIPKLQKQRRNVSSPSLFFLPLESQLQEILARKQPEEPMLCRKAADKFPWRVIFYECLEHIDQEKPNKWPHSTVPCIIINF